MSATIKLLLLGLLGLSGAYASYSVGVGMADVTGPVAEIVFMGYAKMDQTGSGLHLRLFSRAFIIDDGRERFVFVSVDSAMIGHGVKKNVVRKLEGRFKKIYRDGNVMISGTHTHSSPGGTMMDVLFDLTTYGFVQQSFDSLVDGISKSIERAHDSLVPGRIFTTRGQVLDANVNRSPSAYLNNPFEEREKYDYDVDKELVQMQFINAQLEPLGVINWFAVHPTSMNNTNRLVSSDNVGYASILFEQMMNRDAAIGQGPFVAAFASTNLGDVSPNTRGPKCEFSGEQCSERYTCTGKDERCFASGPGNNMFESTKIIAEKIFYEAQELWNNGERTEIQGPIRVIHRYVDMPQQRADLYNSTTGSIEEVRGCQPAMGYSFAAGTTDGPGSFAFHQGTTTSNPFWNIVRNVLAKPTDEDVRCHGAKPILLATGRMSYPYEWQPKIVSTQIAKLGDVIIVGVPGEFTTMSGRRLKRAIEAVTNEESLIIVAGLCNTYSDYVATPEEYEIQRYEGASTIYGPHTLTIYIKQYQELVEAAVLGEEIEPGPEPPELPIKSLISFVTPVLFDMPKRGHKFGDCIQRAPDIVRAGETVAVKFVSGNPRNNLMHGSTFLRVERLTRDFGWILVATDADWETKFEWSRTMTVLGLSEVTITWEVPKNIVEGTYRINHYGYHRNIFKGVKSYRGTSNEFQVLDSEYRG